MNKRIGKAILATVVALSVAILPMTAGFAAASKTVQMSASVTVPDCDHHRDLPNDTTPKRTDGCDSMAGCALKCFTTTVVSFSSVGFIASAGMTIELFRASEQYFLANGQSALPTSPLLISLQAA